MAGSLQKKKGSKYYYAVVPYFDENGKQKQKWLSTKQSNKAEAKKVLIDYQYKMQKGLYKPKDIFFTDFMKKWIENTISEQVEQTTLDGYETCVIRHILPYFNPLHLKLQELKPLDLQNYFNAKYKDGRLDGKGGLSANTLKRHYANLKKALDYAVKMQYIERNPINFVELPKVIPYTGKFLTEDEAKALSTSVAGTDVESAVYLALCFGLRRGEVLGLRWKDISFEKDEVTIQNTRTKVNKSIEKCPKTKSSNRCLSLLPNVKTYLKKLRAKQAEDQLRLGSNYLKNDYVCKNVTGKPLDPAALNHHFKKVLKDNNLPDIRFHDLRHSSASFLFGLGHNVKEIQEWLGHANPSVTANIYLHVPKELNKVMAGDYSSFLGELGSVK